MMLRKIYIFSIFSKLTRHFVFFVLLSAVSNTNSQKLQKSAINSVGRTSSYFTTIHQKRHVILQSVGQSSIIGTKHSARISVQQGFLSNSVFYTINNRESEAINEALTLVVYPNPFIDHVQLKFSKKTRDDIYIRVFDFNGKQLVSKKYAPTDNLYVPMLNYSIGIYIIHVQSGGKHMTKKLLKSAL